MLALADVTGPLGDRVITADGVCDGIILDAPRGTGGFGYDPLFLVPELGQTFAELGVGTEGRALAPRPGDGGDQAAAARVPAAASLIADWRLSIPLGLTARSPRPAWARTPHEHGCECSMKAVAARLGLPGRPAPIWPALLEHAPARFRVKRLAVEPRPCSSRRLAFACPIPANLRCCDSRRGALHACGDVEPQRLQTLGIRR